MKKKVLVTKPIPKEVEEYLRENCEVTIWNSNSLMPEEELVKQLQDITGLITTNKYKIDCELLNNSPKLKFVSNIAVGYNGFDLEEMKKRHVVGMHTPSVLDETVADLAFTLILSAARRIGLLDRYVKEGKWTESIDKNLFGLNVYGKKLGILGLGRIGSKVAKRAKLGFDMEVSYFDAFRKEAFEQELDVRYGSIEKIMSESDFVLVMLPLMKETENLIDYQKLSLMKPTAILINSSRGEIVNETDLIKILEEKKIFGAALDVFHEEPIRPNHPLLQFDNVLTTPHIGSAVEETRNEMAWIAAKNIVNSIKGQGKTYIVPELQELVQHT